MVRWMVGKDEESPIAFLKGRRSLQLFENRVIFLSGQTGGIVAKDALSFISDGVHLTRTKRLVRRLEGPVLVIFLISSRT